MLVVLCWALLLVLRACRHTLALGRWWGGCMMQMGGQLLHLLRCMQRQQWARSNRCAGHVSHVNIHSKKWLQVGPNPGALGVDACDQLCVFSILALLQQRLTPDHAAVCLLVQLQETQEDEVAKWPHCNSKWTEAEGEGPCCSCLHAPQALSAAASDNLSTQLLSIMSVKHQPCNSPSCMSMQL